MFHLAEAVATAAVFRCFWRWIWGGSALDVNPPTAANAGDPATLLQMTVSLSDASVFQPVAANGIIRGDDTGCVRP